MMDLVRMSPIIGMGNRDGRNLTLPQYFTENYGSAKNTESDWITAVTACFSISLAQNDWMSLTPRI